MRYLFVLISSFSLALVSSAQSGGRGCGTVVPSNYSHFTSEQERTYGVTGSPRTGMRYAPVVYHIVQKSNGSGGTSLQTVFETNCELNKGYDTTQIYFYIRRIDTIKNDALWAMDDGTGNVDYQTGYGAFSSHNLANTINVYITGGLPGLCGFATFPGSAPNGGGIFLNHDCCGKNQKTIPHEMGHFFNLEHTFQGGDEFVDGSNCASAGDGFCDTPADPSDQRAACPYTGSAVDGHGDLYSTVVDESLFMSYFNDDCIYRFSPQERNEINATLSGARSNLLNQTMPSVTPLDTTGLVYPLGGSLTLNGTPVTFIWNKVPNAFYYNLFVQSGTSSIVVIDTLTTDTTFTVGNLVANKAYKYKVIPISYGSTCGLNANFQAIKISTVKVTVATTNPSCAGLNDGSINLTPTTGTAPYTFLWSNGETNSSVSGLAPGFYYVTITDAAAKQSVAGIQLTGSASINVGITKSGTTLTANSSGGSGPYTYSWSDGATGPSNTNISFGTYTVTVTDQNGCTATQTFIYSSLGVDLEAKLSMKVFPNPANNVSSLNLRVELNERTDAVVSVINVNGELVAQLKKEFAPGVNNTSIDIASLSSGIYFVQFKSNKTMKIERVSIMR